MSIYYKCDQSTVFFLSIPSNSSVSRPEIARYDPIENSWTKLGNLKWRREGHGVIQVDGNFIVVNGKGSQPNELCKLKRQSMICEVKWPKLLKFEYYPELMLLP